MSTALTTCTWFEDMIADLICWDSGCLREPIDRDKNTHASCSEFVPVLT
jgi:hypothetical protein